MNQHEIIEERRKKMRAIASLRGIEFTGNGRYAVVRQFNDKRSIHCFFNPYYIDTHGAIAIYGLMTGCWL